MCCRSLECPSNNMYAVLLYLVQIIMFYLNICLPVFVYVLTSQIFHSCSNSVDFSPLSIMACVYPAISKEKEGLCKTACVRSDSLMEVEAKG